ncbi:hypothetical protein FACS1894179_00490 [Bacteroidia bacterium]|nr:hypothetical protein FACS1894179_00490 [Bacteroidia bacterium]
MKKYRIELVLIFFFFLYKNTSAYWLYKTGEWADLILLAYVITFLCIIGFALYNLVKCFQAKLKDKYRNIVSVLMIAVLAMTFLLPGGLLPKKVLYKGELLVGYLDGVAGNNGWLVLYGNNTYEYDYGRMHLEGNYKVNGDTIFFDSPRKDGTYEYDYATLWNDKSYLSLGKDSIAYSYMQVVKNELIE